LTRLTEARFGLGNLPQQRLALRLEEPRAIVQLQIDVGNLLLDGQELLVGAAARLTSQQRVDLRRDALASQLEEPL
jgi:hypothetical protein